MTAIDWLFDAALAALVLVLAAGTAWVRQLYTAIVLFIVFGLALALVWGRLGAPDLALAEAAIGAGLTGTLLLSTYAQVKPQARPTHQGRKRVGPALITILVLAVLLVALAPLANRVSPLPDLVNAQLAKAGVAHPVTAVLLNFRAWDTLLELLVLLLALLGIRQLRPTQSPLTPTLAPTLPPPWPLLILWSRAMAPLCVFFSAYLLWRGSAYPGGAFQAGALLAAGGVVLRLNGLLPDLRWHRVWVRMVAVAGLAVFLGAGVWGLLDTGTWMTYPADKATTMILLVEAAATLSIALTLSLLVVGYTHEVTA